MVNDTHRIRYPVRLWWRVKDSPCYTQATMAQGTESPGSRKFSISGRWARSNHSSQTTPHPKNAFLGLIAQFLNAAAWVRLLVASQVPIKLTCMRTSVDVPEAYPLLMLQGTELPGTAQSGDTQQMLRPTQAGMHRQVQSLNSSACQENLSLVKNSNLCWRLRPPWPASLLSKLLDP